MRKNTGRMAALAGLAFLVFATTAHSGEQRSCDTDIAIFPNGSQETAQFHLTVAASDGAARMVVRGSGDWSGTRTRHASGADTIAFRTRAATETLTIGRVGDLLWEIAYTNQTASDSRVVAFVGTCRPWKTQ
ncbi:MAG: hypothetical protein ACK4RZ_17525 [Paracoccaceae bacterium]